jgi:hypothetical protein
MPMIDFDADIYRTASNGHMPCHPHVHYISTTAVAPVSLLLLLLAPLWQTSSTCTKFAGRFREDLTVLKSSSGPDLLW